MGMFFHKKRYLSFWRGVKVCVIQRHLFQVDDQSIDALNEVFLWAVVNGYHKIAMWLWDKCDNSFERVLIAEEIYHKCYRRATKENMVLLPRFYFQCYE